jgi:two-component system response regulator AtoC
LTERLKAEDYDVLEAGTGREALDALREGVDLVLLDYKLPDTDGVTVLRRIKEFDQDILVILLTAYATIETAVEAMKIGAYHFANKPFNLDDVMATVERALETTRLRREVRQLRANEARPYSLNRIVGVSDAMSELRNLVAKVAASPASTVLLTGESGTGKDLVAKVLHYTSDRAGRPFMNITCSALPESLLESELFGHERGAFTDARLQKRGLLETAEGGTVFLDEISEMVPALQAKLLRFLEEKTFKRIGGATDIKVDVRVVAATNRKLEDEVAKGRFRSDLFYRLNVLPIAMPPLRSHPEDIPVLVDFFVDGFNREFRKNIRGATVAAVTFLPSRPRALSGERRRDGRDAASRSSRRAERRQRLPPSAQACLKCSNPRAVTCRVDCEAERGKLHAGCEKDPDGHRAVLALHSAGRLKDFAPPAWSLRALHLRLRGELHAIARSPPPAEMFDPDPEDDRNLALRACRCLGCAGQPPLRPFTKQCLRARFDRFVHRAVRQLIVPAEGDNRCPVKLIGNVVDL